MTLVELRNGRIVTPEETFPRGRLLLEDGQIVRVDQTSGRPIGGVRTIDVGGKTVLPGLVDLHGDDIERHLHPRAGARVDLPTALSAADRTNVLNGVTTKFHAVAFEDAPADDRSLSDAAAVARAVDDADYLLGDNRFHARCELVPESVAAVERVASEAHIDLLSVMHHAPDRGQFDAAEFEHHYARTRDWSPESIERVADERAALSRRDLDGLIGRVSALAERLDVPLASHDDESDAAVDRADAHGVSITEYPLTADAARRAAELGLTTAMGAPNLVRGGSLWDNLSVRTAIDADLVDVLCADYHPPSLLAAPFVDTGEPLSTRVNRVTRNPANAVGLTDRGRIEPGARADVVVVDPGSPPRVERVFVRGREALSAADTTAPRAANVVRELPSGPGS